MPKHKVIFADSRRMPEVADESVQLIVTSPPYWSIKDYGHEDQIGATESYEKYLVSLEKVMSQSIRVLQPGCRAAINIGDQYLRASEHGRYRVLPIPADLTVIGRSLGLDFMGSIIWRKISTTKTSGGGCWMGSTYYPGDGHVTYEHEYIVLFRKPGKRVVSVSDEAKEMSKLTKDERSSWFRGVWDDIRPERQVEHVAMFPLELPRRLIKMYTHVDETILDMFIGSGTTAKAAQVEHRNSIGYEIDESMEETIRSKVGEDADIEFLRRDDKERTDTR